MAAPMWKCSRQLLLKSPRILSIRNVSLGVVTSTPQAVNAQQKRVQPVSPDTPKKIVIPNKVKRDELSVLKALASTVKKDFNAPHYKYMDDPYLIPKTALEKRSYSLARAAGKKAAHYVVSTYPENFLHNPAEPSIQAFMPPAGLKQPDDQEVGLQERIERRLVLVAFESYQKIKQAGNPVSQETLNDLLDLLCFYNSTDRPENALSEEQFFIRDISPHSADSLRRTWKDSGLAEQLFSEMEEKKARAYNSMVRGCAKYLHSQRAYSLYQEMKENKMPVELGTYNALLRICPFLSDQSNERWATAHEILGQMHADGVEPNLFTFNNLLYTVTRSSRTQNATTWCMEIINEMRKLNIEPSLASWWHVLSIYFANDRNQSAILSQILDYLEGKELTLSHPDDFEFFSFAMSRCYNSIQDVSLAHKLDALLNTGSNILLLGDGYKEGLYYTMYMRLLCMFEQIDTIMEHYERITPHAYTPTFGALNDLLQAIELNDGYQYLPQIWSDLVLFEYTRRTDLIEALLRCMAKLKQPEAIQSMFVHIIGSLKEKVQADAQNSRLLRPLMFTGEMLGDMIQIYIHGGETEKAWDIFQMFLSNRYKIDKFPKESALVSLTTACVEAGDVDRTMSVLSVMADFGHKKLEEMSTLAKEKLTLTEDQKMDIKNL